MRFGISAFAWTSLFAERHLEIIPRVRAYGYACLELPMFDPADLPTAKIRRAFEANDLECTLCAILPPGINPISPDHDVRRRSIAHLTQCVEVAAELGASVLGGPLLAPIGYLPAHRPTDDESKWAIEAVQRLTPLLERYEMTLSIEPVNRSETFFLRTASDVLNICRAVAHANVGVTIDSFHANIEEKSIPEALESLGPYLKHVHLSENDRGLLGTGHIDFEAVAHSLRRMNFAGVVVVEGFGYSPDELHSPGFLWASPDVAPEDMAIEGLTFLRRLEKA